jgi:hypothetical protein
MKWLLKLIFRKGVTDKITRMIKGQFKDASVSVEFVLNVKVKDVPSYADNALEKVESIVNDCVDKRIEPFLGGAEITVNVDTV